MDVPANTNVFVVHVSNMPPIISLNETAMSIDKCPISRNGRFFLLSHSKKLDKWASGPILRRLKETAPQDKIESLNVIQAKEAG